MFAAGQGPLRALSTAQLGGGSCWQSHALALQLRAAAARCTALVRTVALLPRRGRAAFPGLGPLRALSTASGRSTLQLGALRGPCIANKATILGDVDAALNPAGPRPPDVEVLLTEHLAYTGNPLSRFLHHNLIALGHLSIRYTTSDGKQHVMNILGGETLDSGGRMVNFGAPEEYLYGTSAFDGWCQQGGAYNRDIVGVRIERAPEGVVDALHAYYRALEMRSEIRSDAAAAKSLLDARLNPRTASPALARFELFGGRVNNFLATHLPPVVSSLLREAGDRLWRRKQRTDSLEPFNLLREERLLSAAGNCAQWTTSGLQWVGLIRRPRLVPKAALIELFEREHRLCPENCHVVVYKRVPHAARFYEQYEPTRSTFVHPLYFLRNLIYARMDSYADVLVSVAPDTDVATVRRIPLSERRRPPEYLPYVQLVYIGTTCAAIFGAFDGPHPVTISASAAAAVWHLLHWWTY